MAEVVVAIRVVITQFVSDEPQPGIVRCEFTDANGQRWTFTEKTATVCMVAIDGQDCYPRPGVILCQVVGRKRARSGADAIAVACEYFPEGMVWDEKTIEFEVLPQSLVEWEWGDYVERSWSGYA